MCLKYMLHTYDATNAPCTYYNCNYAHNSDQISVLAHITKFDALMDSNQPKIPLQLIYYEEKNYIFFNVML
jgi:hypothetical protein